MKHSLSLEANISSASQEILNNLLNPKVCYRILKRHTPVPILSQISPVHAFISNFLKIHFNIILHLHLVLPSGLFPSGLHLSNSVS